MKSILTAAVLIGISSWAIADSRFENALTQNDNRYQLYCELNDTSNFIQIIKSKIPTSFKLGSYLYRVFTLDTARGDKDFSLKVYPNGKKSIFEAQIDGEVVSGNVEEGYSNHYKKRMIFNHPLLKKVTCYAEFAIEEDHLLSDGSHHINVHPHNYYDYRSVTSPVTNWYYSNSNFSSLLLLEDISWKEGRVNLANFIRTGQTGLTHRNPGVIVAKVPASSDIKVSPAGHNRYRVIAQRQLDIVYTGGNHNFCIWNNTRRVFNALLESQNNPILNIVYKQNAIVAQVKGIVGGLSFSSRSIKKSNLLRDLLSNDSVARKYHEAYYNFFAKSQFGYYAHRYATLTLRYSSPNLNKQVVLKGSGSRHMQINIKYE